MNVGELKKMLDKYPDDMKVATSRHSDYCIVTEGEWGLIRGVDKGFYVMSSHDTMSDENKAAAENFLHLYGN